MHTDGMITSKEVLRSRSGRELSPAPVIDTTSVTALRASMRRIDEWLVREAAHEVEHHSDGYVSNLVANLDRARLSQSDRELLNDILFGSERGPAVQHRTTLF